jgi:penicillin-binding protein 1A
MQLARNFYLSREKTYLRKLNEILLALKIERELSKQKILELYLNKIYLGNRSYGVAAAARVYYGKRLEQLSLPEIAMIAGLPKAPSRYNPIINPERAVTRRNYVLSRMHQLNFIDDEAFDEGVKAPVTAKRHFSRVTVQAQYLNEMVRAEIVKQFGEEAYSRGLNVFTTLSDRLQNAANDSLWNGLVNYDRRHGFRGVVKHVDLDEIDVQDTEQLLASIADINDYGRFKPALVTAIETVAVAQPVAEPVEQATDEPVETAPQVAATEQQMVALLKDGEQLRIGLAGVSWAKKYISVNRQGETPKQVSAVVKPGDVVWVLKNDQLQWELGQIPEVQGAMVAIDPNNGAIQALTGGFNFTYSKFNRAVQAKRQAGSGIKPIIYTAALAKSYTPATLINDAPVVFEDAALEGAWRPENYSGKFYGPTRLRMALYKSRNLVSIRLLRSIGIKYATKFSRKFGLDPAALPHDLSLALGSSELSPLQLARAYAVFANGGYLIKPYFIQRIEDADGSKLFEADPPVACVACVLAKQRRSQDVELAEESLSALPKQAEQTLEPRLAYQMDTILRDVIKRGTGRKALQLRRNDLAGKTGTTNDQRDAWFNGYNPDLVAITWVGFDQLKPLGNKETGSSAALPLWIDFMRVALRGKPEKVRSQPEGLVTVKINTDTGELAGNDAVNTEFEIFRKENVPGKAAAGSAPGGDKPIPEQLF